MSTEEEFVKLLDLLTSCKASVRCGVHISDVSDLLISRVRYECDMLSTELRLLESVRDRIR